MPEISKETCEIVDRLEIEEGDLDKKIKKVLSNEIRHRLNQYLLTDQLLQKKYAMALEEFKERNMVEALGYSFEVESDLCDWEMAISRINTLKEDMDKLEAGTRNDH